LDCGENHRFTLVIDGQTEVIHVTRFMTDRKAAMLAAVQGGSRRWGIDFSPRTIF
jgi:hypothetical protein